MSGGGGGKDLVHNIRADQQLLVIEILGVDDVSGTFVEPPLPPWREMVVISAYSITPKENAPGNARAHMRPCGGKYGKT